MAGGRAWRGGMHGGGHAWQVACMAGGGMCGGRHAWQGGGMRGSGACVARGACVADTMIYGQ